MQCMTEKKIKKKQCVGGLHLSFVAVDLNVECDAQEAYGFMPDLRSLEIGVDLSIKVK